MYSVYRENHIFVSTTEPLSFLASRVVKAEKWKIYPNKIIWQATLTPEFESKVRDRLTDGQ